MDSVDFDIHNLSIEPNLNKLLEQVGRTKAKSAAKKLLKNQLGNYENLKTDRCIDIVGEYPSWPNTLGAIPNVFLRSAIFGIGNKDKLLQRERISAPEGYEIYFTGPCFVTEDLKYVDGLFSIVNEDNQCIFTRAEFLKILKLTDGGKNFAKLDLHLSRLASGALDIIQKDKLQKFRSYEGHIIQSKTFDSITGRYVVSLNPKLRYLFKKSNWTLIDCKINYKLRRHPLAQWLYGFYCSHAYAYDLKVTTILKICGSDADKTIHSFEQNLRRAFSLIKKIAESYGETFNWSINDGLVKVSKSVSNSQNRHNIRKLKSNSAFKRNSG